MATVSETMWTSTGRVDFCACCGLRRPLGEVNLRLGPDSEQVRCIDCFFGPADPEFVFIGEAIFNRRDHPTVNFGQTGDVVRDWTQAYFEPHGNPAGRIPVTEEDLYEFNRYQPTRFSRRTPPDED